MAAPSTPDLTLALGDSLFVRIFMLPRKLDITLALKVSP